MDKSLQQGILIEILKFNQSTHIGEFLCTGWPLLTLSSKAWIWGDYLNPVLEYLDFPRVEMCNTLNESLSYATQSCSFKCIMVLLFACLSSVWQKKVQEASTCQVYVKYKHFPLSLSQ